MWIASLTLLVYQCESRSINFTSIIKYYGLSRDVVTCDMNRDVAIAYCGAPYLIKLDFFFFGFFSTAVIGAFRSLMLVSCSFRSRQILMFSMNG